MLKRNDLWIGDKVRIDTLGLFGTYEGISDNGKAIIKSKNKKFESDFSDLSLITNDDTDNEIVDFKNEFVGICFIPEIHVRLVRL